MDHGNSTVKEKNVGFNGEGKVCSCWLELCFRQQDQEVSSCQWWKKKKKKSKPVLSIKHLSCQCHTLWHSVSNCPHCRVPCHSMWVASDHVFPIDYRRRTSTLRLFLNQIQPRWKWLSCLCCVCPRSTPCLAQTTAQRNYAASWTPKRKVEPRVQS